jgi:SAM-dependent methyltransferase
MNKKILRSYFSKIPPDLQDTVRKYHGIYNEIKFGFIICLGKIRRLFITLPHPDIASVKVHLGCGDVNHPDFINVDGYPFPHVHYVSQIDKLSMFKTNSVDVVYASHCLEHFHYNKTKKVIEEWRRVLKDGGELFLSVPDLDKLVAIYKQCGNNPDVIIGQLMGGQNNKYNYHFTAFNIVNLSRLLAEIGFNEIVEWESPYSIGGLLNDFSSYEKIIDDRSFAVSLNIKAKKNGT